MSISEAKKLYPVNWWMVFRITSGGTPLPVAAFPIRELATGWIAEAAHRKNDVIREVTIHLNTTQPQSPGFRMRKPSPRRMVADAGKKTRESGADTFTDYQLRGGM